MSNKILKLWVAADQPDSSWTWAKTVQEAKAAIKSFSIDNSTDIEIIIHIGKLGPQHPVHNQYYLDFLLWLKRYNPFPKAKFYLNIPNEAELAAAQFILRCANWEEIDYVE